MSLYHHSPLHLHFILLFNKACNLTIHYLIDATRNVMEQLEAAMPQAVTVTPEEREAIERVCSSDLCICT